MSEENVVAIVKSIATHVNAHDDFAFAVEFIAECKTKNEQKKK